MTLKDDYALHHNHDDFQERVYSALAIKAADWVRNDLDVVTAPNTDPDKASNRQLRFARRIVQGDRTITAPIARMLIGAGIVPSTATDPQIQSPIDTFFLHFSYLLDMTLDPTPV